MKKVDRIKGIIAFCIITLVIGSFVILGQNHPATRYLAVTGIIVWLITMYLTNKTKKEGN